MRRVRSFFGGGGGGSGLYLKLERISCPQSLKYVCLCTTEEARFFSEKSTILCNFS